MAVTTTPEPDPSPTFNPVQDRKKNEAPLPVGYQDDPRNLAQKLKIDVPENKQASERAFLDGYRHVYARRHASQS
jgi:hypothetical protein